LRVANPLVQTTRRRTQRHRGILGSGSTLIAVEKPERVCRGVQDPLYVAVIARRCEAVTGDVATLIETGETFEVLGARTATEVAPAQGSSSGAPSEVSPELPQAIAPSSARVPAMDEVQRIESPPPGSPRERRSVPSSGSSSCSTSRMHRYCRLEARSSPGCFGRERRALGRFTPNSCAARASSPTFR
jgi:hypothetical protein